MELIYTVRSGDTLSQIAATIRAAAGISPNDIAQANPDVNKHCIPTGTVIQIPLRSGDGKPLRYTTFVGDSFESIAASLSLSGEASIRQIENRNDLPNVNQIEVGEQLAIPQQPDTQHRGYWAWSSSVNSAPYNATFSVAFSGWTNIQKALDESSYYLQHNYLVGEKYIGIGGGTQEGWFQTPEDVERVTSAIQKGVFRDYDGLAYDVEGGTQGLENVFCESFQAAKEKGLKVLVTVSGSAPENIVDAPRLMESFVENDNIDLLSPQLYLQAHTTEIVYKEYHDVSYSIFRESKTRVVPSIVSPWLNFTNAKEFFHRIGVKICGYVQWPRRNL